MTEPTAEQPVSMGGADGTILWGSAEPLYYGPGKVTIMTWPLQIKMKVQEGVNLSSAEHGLSASIYTERVHVGTVKGALIPPFILEGNVPGTPYSIAQYGAGVKITLEWSNISTELTTVALPYTPTPRYGAIATKYGPYRGGYLP